MGVLDRLMRSRHRNAFPMSAAQRQQWEDDGFLILRGCVSKAEVRDILSLVDQQWISPDWTDHEIDILSGPDSGRIFTLGDVPAAYRNHVYKLNNLFARSENLRKVALSAELKPVLAGLLGDDPLICNSLNFERGSQQPYHLDTWYMPPAVDDMMVAVNIALEPVDEDNGPLAFYPGSHKIPLYRFSDGRQNMNPAEAQACQQHIDRYLRDHDLRPVNFIAQPGDVFIWHARLFHGGGMIKDMSRTRKSLVVHYWRTCDVAEEHVRRDESGSYLGRTLRGEIQF